MTPGADLGRVCDIVRYTYVVRNMKQAGAVCAEFHKSKKLKVVEVVDSFAASDASTDGFWLVRDQNVPSPATSCHLLPAPATSCHLLPPPTTSCHLPPPPATSRCLAIPDILIPISVSTGDHAGSISISRGKTITSVWRRSSSRGWPISGGDQNRLQNRQYRFSRCTCTSVVHSRYVVTLYCNGSYLIMSNSYDSTTPRCSRGSRWVMLRGLRRSRAW